jgi:hypothetical protein
VVELVEVVGVVRVAEVRVVAVVGVGVDTGAATVVVVTVDVVTEAGGVTDPDVEVETEVVGVVVAVEVVAGALVVVDDALVVVVEVLVTVVVVDAVVDVVDVVVLAAHEFVSVTSLRSSDPAASPSWLVTAASRSLWLVTPAATVTPGIVIDAPVRRLYATTEQPPAADAIGIAARPKTVDVPSAAVSMNARTCLRITAFVLLQPALT